MIRLIVQYPDYLDENNILQDGTQVIDIKDDFELLYELKNIYNERKVNHVHLEIGCFGISNTFHTLMIVTIPFVKGITPFIKL